MATQRASTCVLVGLVWKVGSVLLSPKTLRYPPVRHEPELVYSPMFTVPLSRQGLRSHPAVISQSLEVLRCTPQADLPVPRLDGEGSRLMWGAC